MPRGESFRSFGDGLTFLPTPQHCFVEREEYAFSIELECGEPSTLPRDVGSCQSLTTGAAEPVECHDFLECAHSDEASLTYS